MKFYAIFKYYVGFYETISFSIKFFMPVFLVLFSQRFYLAIWF